jgi:molecular chaperone GrpE
MFKSKKDIMDKVSKKEEMDELSGQDDRTEPEVKTETDESRSVRQPPDMNITADKLNAKINDLTDKLLRKAADFENYKKRTENELSSFYKFANEKVITDLLPILDDFERLNSAWDEKHDAGKYKEGIGLIYEKFKKVLKQHGLKEMDSIGKPFDVNRHDAMLQVPKDDVESNTVVDEHEKGYYLKDKVIRHAKVTVSSKPDS